MNAITTEVPQTPPDPLPQEEGITRSKSIFTPSISYSTEFSTTDLAVFTGMPSEQVKECYVSKPVIMGNLV